MTTTSADRTASAPVTVSGPFSTAYDSDGVAVITATRSARPGGRTARGGALAAPGSARAVGAYVVKDGDVRWRPAVDLTRLLTTAEVVVGAVVGAVVVADRLARRPSGPKAVVTMGPGGWVSMKGGQLGVRRGSRPWARPRRVTSTHTPAVRAAVGQGAVGGAAAGPAAVAGRRRYRTCVRSVRAAARRFSPSARPAWPRSGSRPGRGRRARSPPPRGRPAAAAGGAGEAARARGHRRRGSRGRGAASGRRPGPRRGQRVARSSDHLVQVGASAVVGDLAQQDQVERPGRPVGRDRPPFDPYPREVPRPGPGPLHRGGGHVQGDHLVAPSGQLRGEQAGRAARLECPAEPGAGQARHGQRSLALLVPAGLEAPRVRHRRRRRSPRSTPQAGFPTGC